MFVFFDHLSVANGARVAYWSQSRLLSRSVGLFRDERGVCQPAGRIFDVECRIWPRRKQRSHLAIPTDGSRFLCCFFFGGGEWIRGGPWRGSVRRPSTLCNVNEPCRPKEAFLFYDQKLITRSTGRIHSCYFITIIKLLYINCT